jgi:hypothetical protein
MGEPSKNDVAIAADKAARDIVYDLLDRRGLSHEWGHIDLDTQEEIIDEWASIIAAEMQRLTNG